MSKITLKNVRLSFPSLFQKSSFNGVEGKYEATLLIPKDSEMATVVKNQIETMLKDNKAKLSSDKICLKDGDQVEYDGYAGNYTLKAGSNKRIQILDRDLSVITEEDEKIYAGCYVNAVISFWYQDNNFGKRINANLLGVQFFSHGEPFGNTVDITNCFENLDGDTKQSSPKNQEEQINLFS